MNNSEIILSQQSHPGDSTLQTLVGEAFKGDGYYNRTDGMHTIQYTVTDFIGSIVIEATLVADPTEDDWFPVQSHHFDIDEFGDSISGSYISNFTGNYVWVRAVLEDWSDGTLNSILMNH